MKPIVLLLAALFVASFISAQAQGTWAKKADLPGIARVSGIGFSIGDKGYLGLGGLTFETDHKDFWEYDPAKDVWTQKADFGGGGRSNATAFTIGNKGYVGLGTPSFDEMTNEFWEYDPVLNKWKKKAEFPGGERIHAVGFSIGNKGYVGTGTSGHCCSFVDHKDFWEYDPATDVWTRKADFGGGLRAGPVGFSIGGKGYVGTGGNSNNSSFNDFWEYNPTTN